MSEVTLRELIEQKICSLDKRIDDRFIALDKALKLQAEKDQRHFEDLNHEQARLLADRERYLPRETYAADRKDKAALLLAIASLAIALLTLIAVLPRWAP
jgi:hypothetical protein